MSQPNEIKAGMVVHAQFPTVEGGALPHFCLVLQVRDEVAGRTWVKLAYGSSKRVIADDPLPGEFILSGAQELKKAGLRCSTRFNLCRLAVLAAAEVKPVGLIPLQNKALARRLKKALRQAYYD